MSFEPSPLRSETFILQPGGLGDVVLTAPLVDAIQRAGQRVVLCVGRPLEGLPALFPTPPDELFALDLNPYASFKSASDLRRALEPLVARLAPYKVTTFIGAAYKANWFSSFVAAVLRPPKIVISPVDGGLDEPMLHAALTEFDLPQPVSAAPHFAEDLAEPERYRMVSEFVTDSRAADREWLVSAAARAAAVDWLRQANIPDRGYILCFPFGNPSVQFKIWPVERFISVLNQVAEAFGLAVVLAGSRLEEEALRAAAARVRAPVNVFAGGPGDFPLLSGIVSGARVFLGNDSGLAHLAQAFRIPGVIIFGGGHWPVYRPWARGVTGIVHSLPCFRCDWDCLFDHGVCVDRITEAVVVEQLKATLDYPDYEPWTIDTSRPGDPEHDLIRRASVRYRAIAREYVRLGSELVRIESEAQRRARAIEDLHREASVVRTDTEALHRELISISGQAEERARSLDAMNAELHLVRAEAEARARALEATHRELVSVSGQADERARALEAMNEELRLVRGEAEARARALEEMHRELVSMRGVSGT